MKTGKIEAAKARVADVVRDMFTRDGRFHTAAEIADEMRVSAATVTRAIAQNGFCVDGVETSEAERPIVSRNYPGIVTGKTHRVVSYGPTHEALRQKVIAVQTAFASYATRGA